MPLSAGPAKAGSGDSGQTKSSFHLFSSGERRGGRSPAFPLKGQEDPNLRFQLWPDQQTMVHTIHEIAAQADWFLPGINEGKLLTGCNSPEDIAKYYVMQGVKVIVIKLGPQQLPYRLRGRPRSARPRPAAPALFRS